MANKAEKERQKLIQEKSQQILSELLKDEDNKYCVDCDAKGPRWASWNLGVFLCIRCAGIHRNLGVHISKVKSVNLDSWSPEQVAHMQRMGNSQARAVYEANLPDNFKRPQSDSPLEAFIRDKYEKKKYIAKEWVQPPTPPPAFDIEEERKKEKEKKKSKAISKPAGNSIVEVQTNPVPRPASNAVTSSTIICTDKMLNGNKKPSTDLLGLSTPTVAASGTATAVTKPVLLNSPSNDDDQFDAFVGCEPIVSNGDNGNKGLSPSSSFSVGGKTSEEDDFFSQKAPEEKKLDKESILKLYGSSSISTQPLFNLNANLGTNNPLVPNLVSNPALPNATGGFAASGLINNNGIPNPVLNATNSTAALNSSGLTNGAFGANASNAVSTGFANFSQQIIPPANHLFNLPQQPTQNTQPNFFQSSTNPFLSPGKSLADPLTTGSAVNQLQSQLGSLDIGGTTFSWPNTSSSSSQPSSTANASNFNLLDNVSGVAASAPATNPFIQPSSVNGVNGSTLNPTSFSNGTSLNAFNNNANINSSLTFNGSNLLGASGSSLNGLNKLAGNDISSSILDSNSVNWSTLGSSTTNPTVANSLATGNLWP